MIRELSNGRLLAFDQDPEAKTNVRELAERSFTLIEANFRYLTKYLRFHGVMHVDGILADLGVSSHQIDEPARGFSTRFKGSLDMRMNPRSKKNAIVILNEYSEHDLIHLFSYYGDIRNARSLAAAVVGARKRQSITDTQELMDIVGPLARRGAENRYAAQVFQAIRIEVNEEMEALKEFLQATIPAIGPSGRLVVITYHSLEDRLVKNFMQYGNFEGKPEKDFYGNLIRPFRPVNRKPIVATPMEINRNKRARSAKLRIAEKLTSDERTRNE
jgi:16S rRNA (cytosine1402-N4)-methyltransferase